MPATEDVAPRPGTPRIHVDDAARAAVAALEWPSGVNVCDDEPATGREWVPVFCAAVGAPPPPQAPTHTPGARGTDNGRVRPLGWRPAARSWRTGFRALAGAAP
jgi:nucleoside-diphosphate-sugar epimerase